VLSRSFSAQTSVFTAGSATSHGLGYPAGDDRLHDPAHCPVVLSEATGPHEAMGLEHRDRRVVEERPRNRPSCDILGVTLDRASAEAGDLLERAPECDGCDPLTAILPVDEETGDPPVREGGEGFQIGAPVLDARQLGRRAELAPAYAGRTVENEGSVSLTFQDAALLLGTVLCRGLGVPHAFWVKGHAPASAPYAVVLLDQTGKVRPGRFVQRLDQKSSHSPSPRQENRRLGAASVSPSEHVEARHADFRRKVFPERLGHATVSITLDTYSHAIPAMQEEAAVKIAELVFAVR
jgi:hypothetical protein